jgi:hypothetical protein
LARITEPPAVKPEVTTVETKDNLRNLLLPA